MPPSDRVGNNIYLSHFPSPNITLILKPRYVIKLHPVVIYDGNFRLAELTLYLVREGLVESGLPFSQYESWPPPRSASLGLERTNLFAERR